MPHEHRAAARPAKTSPIYPLLLANGAVFEQVNGWERTSFYKPDSDFIESHGYQLQNWHPVVAAEIGALSKNVGLAELSGFNHYRIRGSGVIEWLGSLTCSRLSPVIGKTSLCYFLTARGNISSEATILPLPDGSAFYGSAATAEYHDRDWLLEHLPGNSDIRIESHTNTHTLLLVAGPNTRKLMASVSPRTRWGQEDFPWLSGQTVYIGHVEALAIAISYSGEQAFELHIPNEQLYAAYQILSAAGEAFNLGHFGMYAIDSMRLEKGYGHWKSDFITEFNPIEAGLERFIDLSKNFPGKNGLLRQQKEGKRKVRVLLSLDSTQTSAQPGEGVFFNHIGIGSITSAGWGLRCDTNLAMAYIDPDYASADFELEVMLLGAPVKARVCKSCLYDPDNLIPKGL